jgi:integrase
MAEKRRGREFLTDRQARSLPAGMHADGGGLYLVVKEPGGPKAWRGWVHRYTAPTGKRRERGLGAYPDVPLAAARDKAAEGRAMLAEGRDPLDAERAEAPALATFGAVAERYIAGRESGWRNAKHAAQWRMTLAVYCADFARLPVADVEVAHVDAALRPLWLSKPETARRLRARIALVLDYASVTGLRPPGVNPARSVVAGLPKQAKKAPRHHPAPDFAEARALWLALVASPDPVALAVRFQMLTAARPGEVRRARWSEIAAAIETGRPAWVVPAERMKSSREHRVPLSRAAVEVLQLASAAAENVYRGTQTVPPDALIFRTVTGRGLNENSARNLVRELVPGKTAHGMRSTFRDWCEEHDVGGRVAEAALAHVVRDATERAYQRSDLFKKRADLMDRWAAYLTNSTAAGGTGKKRRGTV